MKSLEEAKKLDLDGILKEISDRRTMLGQMVGWLYPSILRDEIVALDQEWKRKKYGGDPK